MNPSTFTSRKINKLITKEARIAKEAIIPESDFEILFLPKPLNRNPINGNNGMRYVSLVIELFS
jgi:hypothetical protein